MLLLTTLTPNKQHFSTHQTVYYTKITGHTNYQVEICHPDKINFNIVLSTFLFFHDDLSTFLFFQISSVTHDQNYISTKRPRPLAEIERLKNSYPEFMDFKNKYTKAKETVTIYETMQSKDQVVSLNPTKENDKIFQYYTGLPSFLVSDALLDYFTDETSNMQYF